MDAFHQKMLDPSIYPDHPASVESRETHISTLFLTDGRVYKIKKPLDLGFLDFTTLAKRQHFCHEEVRLNRRFAPDTYLAVVEIYDDGGEPNFEGRGELVDHAVCMRRLPQEAMLEAKLDRHDDDLEQEVLRLADHLAALLDGTEVCRFDEGRSNADHVRENCLENLEQTRPEVGTPLLPEAHAQMRAATIASLESLHELFLEREAEGFVRDGHGDLHAGNICMTDPIRIYDCIEFNRRFRVADTAADLAFLLMDLDYRQRRDLGEALLARYICRSEDERQVQLIPFYKSYRAWVRGKVEGIFASEVDIDAPTREAARRAASRHFNLALGYLVPPSLILTTGLMGVGKTTIAGELAAATGTTHLRSDICRKQLLGLSPQQRCHEPYGAGLYAASVSRQTYRELLRSARRELAMGRPVIVDASFSRATDRSAFLSLAVEQKVPCWLLQIACAPELALERLDARQADRTEASDGRSELFRTQAEHFDPVEPSDRVVKIDSSRNIDYNVQSVLCSILADQESVT